MILLKHNGCFQNGVDFSKYIIALLFSHMANLCYLIWASKKETKKEKERVQEGRKNWINTSSSIQMINSFYLSLPHFRKKKKDILSSICFSRA